MKHPGRNRLHLGKLGVVAALAVCVFGWNAWSEKEAEAERPAPVQLQLDTKPLAPQLKQATSYAEMLKTVTPSVVNIFTAKTVTMQQHPMMQDPFFRRFFGDTPDQPRQRQQPSLGSGVIVSSNGYILTNSHVVADADEIKVALVGSRDEKQYDAKLIGTDPKTDIAVLKVDAKDLPALKIGDSNTLEVGDLVFAIGNPFGVGQTVTSGIVSAVGRGNLGITDYEDFIQTDASINPGNSGGALIDAAGRLVGINTAILSRTGGNNGIGFAVPINMARSVMERLTEYGRVVRGYLGVVIQPVTEPLAKRFELESTRGALVSDLMSGSAAEEAGIKAGDVIVEFDGKRVNGVRDLRLMVEVTPPKTKVPVVVMREGKRIELAVALKEMPAEAVADSPQGAPTQNRFLRGVELQDISPRIREALELPSGISGALIASIEPGTPAARAGLQQGDVILEIDRRKVDSAAAATRLLNNAKGDNVLLYVWSNGRRHYVAVDAAE